MGDGTGWPEWAGPDLERAARLLPFVLGKGRSLMTYDPKIDRLNDDGSRTSMSLVERGALEDAQRTINALIRQRDEARRLYCEAVAADERRSPACYRRRSLRDIAATKWPEDAEHLFPDPQEERRGPLDDLSDWERRNT